MRGQDGPGTGCQTFRNRGARLSGTHNSIGFRLASLLAISTVASAQATFSYNHPVSSVGWHELQAQVPDQTNPGHSFYRGLFLLNGSKAPTSSSSFLYQIYLGQAGQPVMVGVADGVVNIPGVFFGTFGARTEGPLKNDLTGNSNLISLRLVKYAAAHHLSASMWVAPGEEYRGSFDLSSSERTGFFIQDVPFEVSTAGSAKANLLELKRTEGGLPGSGSGFANGTTRFSYRVTVDTNGDGMYDNGALLKAGAYSLNGSGNIPQNAKTFPIPAGRYILRLSYQSDSSHHWSVSAPPGGSISLSTANNMWDRVQFDLSVQ